MRFYPDRLWARFALLLLISLICANAISAYLIAREGTLLDQTVRVERDMGRLVTLIETLETLEPTDEATAHAVLQSSGTGYTRFSVDPTPLVPGDVHMIAPLITRIAENLNDHEVRAVRTIRDREPQDRMTLVVLSVRLNAGVYSGKWLNSLVYPLTPATAWRSKAGFFIPLGVSLLGSLLVGIAFTWRMMAPLRRIADAAQAAGRGNHFARLPETGAQELRNVASAFNEMQQRIAAFDAERQQMVAAIGHDLRTPITSLRLRVSLSEDDENRADMIRILDEMAVMAQDLVVYSRASDSSEQAVRLDLAPLVSRICAEENAVFEAGQSTVVMAREIALSRAIRNLVDNAVRYAGAAEVALSQTAKQAVITVMDRGPGLPDEALDKVTKAFVRHETSRNSETGGAGLGLAIAERIARDHGGRLTLRHRDGGGLLAELTLPTP